jgi:hypothetical protein
MRNTYRCGIEPFEGSGPAKGTIGAELLLRMKTSLSVKLLET